MLSMLGLTALEALTSGVLGVVTGLAVNAVRAWNHPLSRLAGRLADRVLEPDEPPAPKPRKTNAKK
jgi:hypothetical protein